MGSLFSTPKPVMVSNPVTNATTTNDAAADTPTGTETATGNARKEALERRRYGRSSLITTSFRGLLNDRITGLGGGKNLLGE
ncbi:hypothetical protein ACTU44_17285 [Thalassospira sp. SM2505]